MTRQSREEPKASVAHEELARCTLASAGAGVVQDDTRRDEQKEGEDAVVGNVEHSASDCSCHDYLDVCMFMFLCII